jgi:3-oxoacyl-[acyl-carrier-protein] synthase-3
MITDTRRLLTAGLELAKRTWDKAVHELEWTLDRFDVLAIHQVSRVHTEQLVQTIGLQLDQVVRIYPEYGNVGPASVPMALAVAVEEGRIKKGDRVGLLGIGSGLNCAMAELVW